MSDLGITLLFEDENKNNNNVCTYLTINKIKSYLTIIGWQSNLVVSVAIL